MKIRFYLPLLAALSLPLPADQASHQKAASDIIELFTGPQVFRSSFAIGLEPMLENMRNKGASEDLLKEFRQAFNDWLDEDLKWDDMKAEIVALYVREFTEPELTEIMTFYRTPAGQKTVQKLPILMQEGAQIGQAFARKKEPALMNRLEKIMAKHKAAAANP